MKLVEFIKNNHLSSVDEIVFFGGSFRPWHNGHNACIKLLPKNLPLIIIPDHNPLKSDLSHKDLRKEFDFMNKVDRKSTYLYNVFYRNGLKNPTYTWINELKSQSSNKLSLLMGFDSIKNIGKWFESKKLIESLHTIYVVSRGESEEEMSTINNKLKDKITYLGHHQYEDLSSTKIRNNFN